jgi:predicted phosphodiesterase
MSRRKLFVLVGALLLGACMSTSYHLVSEGDMVKVLVTPDALPDAWEKPPFDDSKWADIGGVVGPLEQASDGKMPNVAARRHFDLGAQAMSYKTLDLTVTTQGSWTAFLNGQQVAVSGANAGSSVSFAVPDGLLKASDNVLALQVQPVAGTSMLDLKIMLDGTPDAAAAGQPQVARGPWLTSPTPTGVTVVWETNVPTASTLIVDTRSYDGGAGTHHQVVLTDLEPSKAYPYHVETNGVKSEEATLTTAAKPGERVRFVVYGDNRTNGDAHRRIAEAIEAEGPDFVLNTGDLVANSNEEEWNDFFNIEYNLIRHTPTYPTIGNHEASSGGNARFAELFPMDGRQNVGGEVYGADFGDVHVAALDSNGDLNAQAKWLDEDFTKAEQRGAKHLFAFMHWGPYSSGTSLSHGSNKAARAVADVATQHHARAIFSGHDHFYERGQSDQLTYFVTGGGGAPLNSAGKIAETQVTRADYHYLVVDVSGGQVTVTAKDPAGTAFDAVSLSQ